MRAIGIQSAIIGKNITRSIPVICKQMNGRTETKISCSLEPEKFPCTEWVMAEAFWRVRLYRCMAVDGGRGPLGGVLQLPEEVCGAPVGEAATRQGKGEV